MLKSCYIQGVLEAGCDEAGRGPLAGSVFAAAVVLPPLMSEAIDTNSLWNKLNDSKQLTEKERFELRPFIEQHALAWAVAEVTAKEIDKINILNASLLGMRRALDMLSVRPVHILVDGNKWKPYYYGCTLTDTPMMSAEVPAKTVVHGDATYMSIAAASVLAKTYRDDYMIRLHEQYPVYHWNENKGYPTKAHYEALRQYGPSPYHRMTFRL